VRRLAPGVLRCDGRCLSLARGVQADARAQYRLIEAITSGEQSSADAGELRLLRGDLLPDWDEPWLTPVRQELRQLRLISLEALAAEHLDQDRPATALAVALSVARDEPLRESAHRLVIQAHLAHGNRAEAARQYRHYRQVLWTELKLSPDAGIQALISPVLSRSAKVR
jgi:DNA-binding SARP family transcriptional activator